MLKSNVPKDRKLICTKRGIGFREVSEDRWGKRDRSGDVEKEKEAYAGKWRESHAGKQRNRNYGFGRNGNASIDR